MSRMRLNRGQFAEARVGDRRRPRRDEDLFTLWKDADADLPVLADARKEYAKPR
jgi:hypothetical protein